MAHGDWWCAGSWLVARSSILPPLLLLLLLLLLPLCQIQHDMQYAGSAMCMYINFIQLTFFMANNMHNEKALKSKPLVQFPHAHKDSPVDKFF